MIILIELIQHPLPSKTIEYCVEGKTSLQDLSLQISKEFGIQALLLPLSQEAITSHTVEEYYAITQKNHPRVSLKVIDSNTLNDWEKQILTSVAMPLPTEPTLDFKRIIPLLSKTLPQEILESFIVRFGDIATMFGLTAWDTVTHAKGRSTLQIHPYSWVKAGASAVIIYQDMRTVPYVLLVYNKRTDRRPLTIQKEKAVFLRIGKYLKDI
ncbi:MAG TPA: hypothetical protein VHD33_06555 [Legionellaceae bacterium]|nr:hypothetical protein [Legionellaceae bacterium]